MEFKIIALKPLSDCTVRNKRILKVDTIYYLLNNFKVLENSIEKISSITDNFHKTGKIDINVSAIVGKNGSGKSSLIELLIRTINNLSIHFKVETDIKLIWIEGLHLELYYQANDYYKVILNERNISVYKQTDNVFKEDTQFDFSLFFYSVLINYSHYGLNADDIGIWINSLFHKNDGYQTPIVINPMRDHGNIEINNENSLTKARFIANLLSSQAIKKIDQLKISNNLKPQSIFLELKKNYDPFMFEERIGSGKKEEVKAVYFSAMEVDHDKILRTINELYDFGYSGEWTYDDSKFDKTTYTTEIKNLAYIYIVKKLIRIAITYPPYKIYFKKKSRSFSDTVYTDLFPLLVQKDDSHVAFKLKQILNFLKYKHLEITENRTFEITELSDDINKLIKSKKLKSNAIIELIPPPIFKIGITMVELSEPYSTVLFEDLSSGEKQLVYSVNSIIYHLINLDSVKKTKKLNAYKIINIVLEEIELYFHPDMQREFVKLLLDRINELKYKKISAINICLVTHSPFILSDVPASNILFLNDDGSPNVDLMDIETFGSNIHDLLKHSFFLKNGSMGEFAKNKIRSTIDWLNTIKKDIKAKKEVNLKDEVKDYHRNVIKTIGESILRRKLAEMFDEITKEETELSILDEQIGDLQNRRSKLITKTNS